MAPDGSPLRTLYPNGEALEITEDGLLLTWRDLARQPLYQRASYVLDVAGLKVKWGNLRWTESEAARPALGPAEPCDGASVTRYDHSGRDQW